MSEDQALQVARAGVALTDEYEYRQAYRRVREAIEAAQRLRARIIQTWFDEHYPQLEARTSPVLTQFYGTGFAANIETTIGNPAASLLFDISAVNRELNAYLATLEAWPPS